MTGVYALYQPQRRRCGDAVGAGLKVARCETIPAEPLVQLIVTAGSTVHIPPVDVVPVVWQILRVAGDPLAALRQLGQLAQTESTADLPGDPQIY